MEALRGETAEKQEELEQADSSWLEAQRRVELVNQSFEWENELSMLMVKEDQLEKRIREQDKEISDIYDRVAVLDAEKAQLPVSPYSSNASDFPNIPREMYEEWVHAKA